MMSTPWLAAHMKPQVTYSGYMSCSLFAALMDTRVEVGAMPSIPMPLWLAAMMPATCVPWK